MTSIDELCDCDIVITSDGTRYLVCGTKFLRPNGGFRFVDEYIRMNHKNCPQFNIYKVYRPTNILDNITALNSEFKIENRDNFELVYNRVVDNIIELSIRDIAEKFNIPNNKLRIKN